MLFHRRKIEISCGAFSIVQHQLLLPSEPGPDPACNYTLHFTDVPNPAGDSTGQGWGKESHSDTLLTAGTLPCAGSSVLLLFIAGSEG